MLVTWSCLFNIKHNYLSRNLMFVLNISTASRSLLQQTEVTDVSHDQCHVTKAGVGLVAAKCGVVYDIQCPECDQHYIRETARTLGTRIKEHLSCRQPLSAISEHKLNTGHQCSMNDVNILDHEENWHRRKIKEAINIHRKKPTLNRDVGQELPPVLLQLVSLLNYKSGRTLINLLN